MIRLKAEQNTILVHAMPQIRTLMPMLKTVSVLRQGHEITKAKSSQQVEREAPLV